MPADGPIIGCLNPSGGAKNYCTERYKQFQHGDGGFCRSRQWFAGPLILIRLWSILNGAIELVFMALGAAKLGAAIGSTRDSRMPCSSNMAPPDHRGSRSR